MSEREFGRLKRGSKSANPRKGRISPTEHEEQVALIGWVQANEHQWPELKLLHAIPNGGSRESKVDRKGNRYSLEALRFRAEGVKRGYPDLALDVARRGFHGLRIEMKAEGGRLSPEQKWWLRELGAQGYCAVVKHGADEAIAMLRWYLGANESGKTEPR